MKKDPKGRYECVNCGSTIQITKDHIPPRCIFSKPWPENLITVPCCEKCRKDQSMDDEYFRTIIATSGGSQYHDDANKIWKEKVKKSFLKPNKKGFMEGIRNILVPVDVYTEGGQYLGEDTAFKYDPMRINAVIRRIVRGLYFIHSNNRLSEDFIIRVKVRPKLDLLSDELKGLISDSPIIVRGENTFTYKYLFASDEKDSAIFYLTFYEAWAFLCFVVKKVDHDRIFS